MGVHPGGGQGDDMAVPGVFLRLGVIDPAGGRGNVRPVPGKLVGPTFTTFLNPDLKSSAVPSLARIMPKRHGYANNMALGGFKQMGESGSDDHKITSTQ